MINVDVLFRVMEELPLNAVEQVHDFINSQPHKIENRQPTREELQKMASGLQALIAELQQKYPKESEVHPDIEMLEKMSRGKKA